MAFSSVQLSRSQNASCVLKSLPLNNGRYLSCDVKSNSKAVSRIPLEVLRGSRSFICEDPKMLANDPMGICAYKFENLSRCGCPEHDPKRNPQFWNSYIESVKAAFKERMPYQREMTVTIFASGQLLQDTELLDLLFADEEIKKWNGALKLQFVDLKYDVKQLDESAATVDWTKMAPAIGIALCAVTSIVYGASKKKKQWIVAGVIFLIAALILGNAAKKNGKVVVKEPIMGAIDQFLELIENRAPFELHTDFFPSSAACAQKGKSSDLIIGYDIDNTMGIFEQLRTDNLKSRGSVIVATKEIEPPNPEVKKVLRFGIGPGDQYQKFYF